MIDKLGGNAETRTGTSFAVCTLLKAPFRETVQFVNFYLNAGADRIFLFFDDPHDPAATVVAAHPRVTATLCDESLWESLAAISPVPMKMEDLRYVSHRMSLASLSGLRFAEEEGLQWLIHLDQDELLFPARRLTGLLSTVPEAISVVRFPPLEAIPPSGQGQGAFLDTRWFRAGERGRPHGRLFPSRWNGFVETLGFRTHREWFRLRRSVAQVLGIGRVFRVGHYKGHIQGKCAIRVGADIKWLRSHYPIPPIPNSLRLRTAKGVALLHFDCQGYPEWRDKWIQRIRKETAIDLRYASKKRKVQFGEFAQRLEKGDEDGIQALFREYYRFTPYEMRVLRGLGLVREIRVPAEMFDPA